jgi:hypothetical protein
MENATKSFRSQPNSEARSSASAGKVLCQREQILQLLRERGSAGATNIELNEIAFRYGGRIHELRRLGHTIRTENLGDGRFRFVFVAKTLAQKQRAEVPQGRGDDSASLPLFACLETVS